MNMEWVAPRVGALKCEVCSCNSCLCTTTYQHFTNGAQVNPPPKNRQSCVKHHTRMGGWIQGETEVRLLSTGVLGSSNKMSRA